MDVDSLFALDAPSLDENSSKGPSSSVFFDSAPTAGRASRFRTLFAQHSVPQPQQLPPEPGNRPNVDRRQSLPMYSGAPKPSASVEDREGFQRIMAMLGGGGGKTNMPNVFSRWTYSNCSSWINLRLCSHYRSHPCRTVQDKVNQKTNSSNVFFDKVSRWAETAHHLSQVLQ